MQRESVAVGQDMVLGAPFPTIRGVRSSEIAPLFARTLTESRQVLDQSIMPAWPSSSSMIFRSASHAPASDHSRRRRQQVTPDPYPNSGGSFSTGSPVSSTNTIPANTFRSGTRGCPARPLTTGGRGGINGSSRSHNISVMNRSSASVDTRPASPLTSHNNHRHADY
uniref:C.xyli insertion sequence IS1237 n=1 Tax=Leifsonia xyli TaxID=1575 RepID=Q46489_9MICO|nr:unnamed protein product [Leifsonia xyli subsp. cynodontis]